jgi:Secretion system C-terminal sorting domain
VNENLVGAKVSVYNLIGQKTTEFRLNNLTNTSSLGKGIYLLVIDKDGNSVTKKLIVN